MTSFELRPAKVLTKADSRAAKTHPASFEPEPMGGQQMASLLNGQSTTPDASISGGVMSVAASLVKEASINRTRKK